MNSKIWLSPPHMGGSELKYIQQAFDENWISSLGTNINSFEESLEEFLGENTLVTALSSGTAAIHLALTLAGVKKGDEVLCQSFTFCASANPITYLGAKPVFVDSEIETWNMSPVFLEEAIKQQIEKGKKPKAIVLVHLYGMPAKIEAIVSIAKKYEIALIEDAAEALGSTYKGQKCGTFGDYGILSFNGNKIITTSGGGALISKDKREKERAIFFATQAKEERNYYEHKSIGYNYRISNILAGIGRGQMDVLDKHIILRRKINAFYKELFKQSSSIQVFSEPNDDYFSNHWLSCITINKENTKVTHEDIRKALLDHNIESRLLWKPLHLQPVYKDCDFYGDRICESLFNNGLCLPSGSNLNNEDLDRIENSLKQFL